jgi:hypothetical protein
MKAVVVQKQSSNTRLRERDRRRRADPARCACYECRLSPELVFHVVNPINLTATWGTRATPGYVADYIDVVATGSRNRGRAYPYETRIR